MMASKVFLLLIPACIVTIYAQSCTSPDSKPGQCIIVNDCPSLNALLNKQTRTQQETNFLRRSLCGYQGQTPKVCCPYVCRTPEGETAQCVDIFSCQHLLQLLQPPLNEANAQIVRNHRCAEGPSQNSVCCGTPRQTQTPVNRPVQPVTPATVPVSTGACQPNSQPPGPGSKCCGRESSFGNRITGGNLTNIDQYPWLTLIEYRGNNRIKLLCGGALISSKYVLTAGHCLKGAVLRSGTPVNVRLGEYDTSTGPEDCVPVEGGNQDCNLPVVIMPIESIIPHPQYDPREVRTRMNDIGLIRLAGQAPYTEFIRPICLPTFDITQSPPADLKLYAAGWGAVDEQHSSSTIKLHVDLPYKTLPQCQPSYTGVPRRTAQLWGKQLCAGGDKGKDSCKGDSGGPLMYENEEIFEVVGIVSFGPIPCGMEGVPGVYTKVWEYNNWIRSTIQP